MDQAAQVEAVTRRTKGGPARTDREGGDAGCGGQDEAGGGFGDGEVQVEWDAGVGVGGEHDGGVAELLLNGLEASASAQWARVAAPWRRSCRRTGGRAESVTRRRKRRVR